MPSADCLLLWFLRLIGLAPAVRHVHAFQHVVGEEKLAVGRDHHDLQLVRQLLGDDLVDQQRILLQDCSFVPHAFGVGDGGHANAFGFSFSKQLTTFHLGLTINDFGFGHGFGILDRRFFVGFSFKFGLLNLLLLQRQRVLHGVGFSFGLKHAYLGLTLSLLYLLRLRSFGFEL